MNSKLNDINEDYLANNIFVKLLYQKYIQVINGSTLEDY